MGGFGRRLRSARATHRSGDLSGRIDRPPFVCPTFVGSPVMSTSPEDLLGPNSWLVDEYREAYEADPSSVSEQWRNYFSNGAATAGDGNGARAAASTTSSSCLLYTSPSPRD